MSKEFSEYSKSLMEQLEITEEIVNKKYKFKVNPILGFIGLLLIQLSFLFVMLLTVGGPI
jgi:hypothetical protein